jgi:hypothetical protein
MARRPTAADRRRHLKTIATRGQEADMSFGGELVSTSPDHALWSVESIRQEPS